MHEGKLRDKKVEWSYKAVLKRFTGSQGKGGGGGDIVWELEMTPACLIASVHG